MLGLVLQIALSLPVRPVGASSAPAWADAYPADVSRVQTAASERAAWVRAAVVAWSRSPAADCIRARADAIARAMPDSAPAPLLLAIGMQEGHLGCARRGGGSWGVPRQPGPGPAAAALAAGYVACGSWVGAVARFRTGQCVPTTERATREVSGYFPHIRWMLRTLADAADARGLATADARDLERALAAWEPLVAARRRRLARR